MYAHLPGPLATNVPACVLPARRSPLTVIYCATLCSLQELLAYVEQCHHLLDTINLATVLYRLARLYSFVQITEQKAAWRRELMDHPVFTILLRKNTESSPTRVHTHTQTPFCQCPGAYPPPTPT